MLNVEKYKDELADIFNTFAKEGYGFESAYRAMEELYTKHCEKQKNYGNFKLDFAKMLNWLLSEYKEPILDEVERKYLSKVINPFKKKIKFIQKREIDHYERIGIILERVDQRCAIDALQFPLFPKGTMYKNMEINKDYTPKELGL